jgi:putative ABC transport system permease protein
MVGLALVSAMAVFGASISSSATKSISDAISADYIVTASSTGGPPTGFSTAAQAQLRAVPGVTDLSTVYAGQFQIHHGVSTLAGIAAADLGRTIILRVDQGDAAAALSGGELLIDSTKANNDHLVVGSVVPVLFADTGATTLKVGAIYKPNAVLGSYLVGLSTFQEHFRADALPVAMLLKASGGPSPSLTKALDQALSGYPNLKVQTRAEFEAAQQQQVNQLLGLVYVLLALAILIAMIGIVNTLMLSVFERTREIGLLRAVGMRRRQVRSMIRAEAVILAVFGAVLGIVVGTGLGLALADSLKEQGITDVVVPYGSLVVFLVLAGLLGLAAASWPARRAAKLNVLEAISVD